MSAVTAAQMADMDDTARFACALTEKHLDARIEEKKLTFDIEISHGGTVIGIERNVRAMTSTDALFWAEDHHGLDRKYRVVPA